MADHEEPALPPPPAAAPAAPNPAAPAPVVEPLDVPAPAAEPEVIFVVTLSILLCVVGFASVGFSPVCLGLSPSPVSLLFRTPFASFSFCRLAECLAVFRMYFVFWLVCVSLSLGSLSCSLAFVFRFHIPFYLGLFI